MFDSGRHLRNSLMHINEKVGRGQCGTRSFGKSILNVVQIDVFDEFRRSGTNALLDWFFKSMFPVVELGDGMALNGLGRAFLIALSTDELSLRL